MKQAIIGDYMTPAPFSIGYDQTVAHARERMHEHNCRHLPVLRGGEVVGVLSDRDVWYVESFRGVEPGQTLVEEAMAQDPYVFAPDAKLQEVVETMFQHRLGAALVVKDNRCVGIFTTVDALGLLARVQEVPPPRKA